ncbi:MAG: type I-E CRISPR-associated protein Cas5/CasD [Acetatifactor sp.]
MYTLLLRLNGPFQSWGSDSLYDNRGTDNYPTKSGVIGMLAAAMGRKRGDSLDDLNMLRFGIRIDNPGIKMSDFQITNMGEKLNANLSRRDYLSDATFLVGVSSKDKDYLLGLKDSLEHPKYALYLGRKSCPPSFPIQLGIVESNLHDALISYEWLVPEWRRNNLFLRSDRLRLRIIAEDEEGALKKDVPISFDSNHRQYGYRYLREMQGKMVYRDDCPSSTTHDPLEELG